VSNDEVTPLQALRLMETGAIDYDRYLYLLGYNEAEAAHIVKSREQPMSRSAASELYEHKLRELCSDEEWAIFHRRLHPEEYPPEKPGFWARLRRSLV
jgi:hypothetical protein